MRLSRQNKQKLQNHTNQRFLHNLGTTYMKSHLVVMHMLRQKVGHFK